MNRKVSVGVTISIAAIVCALTFIITSFVSLEGFNEKVQAVKEKAEKYERLEALDTYIRENYYTTELNEDGLMDGILKGYVSGLDDPYSRYMTAEEYSALMTKEAGQQIGIGVTVQRSDEGWLHIITVEEGSPAETAGLQSDDLIIAVNGEQIAELEYEEAVSRVRGEEGTKVTLTIRRDGKDKNIQVERRSFDVRTVFSQMLDGQIGYIRISNFRENTAGQFQEALDALVEDGARSLLFDVRDNGGGLLSALEKMLDPLLPEGVIATATYQGGRTETVVYSDAEELNLPIAVLVNGNSASAAELFSASLHDFKDAQLVGTQTYGKGVMQVTRQMEDGGGLSLTVATYQTARSECYDGVGLTPDVEVESSEETDITAADPDTDPQLAAAVQLLLG
ncbi:MAG: S41 family peptidase [Oscillospiraceae bacterium]|nr:S41 family peptidase [Oscillospiraceae bacterium]